MPSKTIVLIHGNFITRHCWDLWVARYQSQGYTCVPIAYPGRDKSVAELKQSHPDPALAQLTLSDVLEHHTKIIQSLNEKPILIGHSFGGLVTQLLLQRDLGVAAVAVNSVPPLGVIATKWSFYRATWHGINPLIPASEPYYMTFAQFQYAFVNTLPLAEQRAAYDEFIVPESRRLMRGALSTQARIDFRRAKPPLLMIAGELDHIMPASLNRSNAQHYKASPSLTEFKEFPERTHHILAQSGWEEVADYALNWAVKVEAPTKTNLAYGT